MPKRRVRAYCTLHSPSLRTVILRANAFVNYAGSQKLFQEWVKVDGDFLAFLMDSLMLSAAHGR